MKRTFAVPERAGPFCRAYAMGMPATARYWTPDDVRALPDDGKRYESIDGELLVEFFRAANGE